MVDLTVYWAIPPGKSCKSKEQEFFSGKDDAIANASARTRKRAIADLGGTDPALDALWAQHRRDSFATEALLKKTQLYPLAGLGKLNTTPSSSNSRCASSGRRAV